MITTRPILRLIEDSTSVEIPPGELSGGYGHFIQRLVKEVTATLKESESLSIDEAIEQAIFFEESSLSISRTSFRLGTGIGPDLMTGFSELQQS